MGVQIARVCERELLQVFLHGLYHFTASPTGGKGGKGGKGNKADAAHGEEGTESLDDIAGIPETKARFDRVLEV